MKSKISAAMKQVINDVNINNSKNILIVSSVLEYGNDMYTAQCFNA